MATYWNRLEVRHNSHYPRLRLLSVAAAGFRARGIASGLYTMATSSHAMNFSTMYAAYAISSIPLLILYIYATKPFIQAMTEGAIKA